MEKSSMNEWDPNFHSVLFVWLNGRTTYSVRNHWPRFSYTVYYPSPFILYIVMCPKWYFKSTRYATINLNGHNYVNILWWPCVVTVKNAMGLALWTLGHALSSIMFHLNDRLLKCIHRVCEIPFYNMIFINSHLDEQCEQPLC